jgi:hypothetical protein
MIKFKKREHVQKREAGKLVIYYNITDIFLGAALMALVIFFMHDYLSHQGNIEDDQPLYTSHPY